MILVSFGHHLNFHFHDFSENIDTRLGDWICQTSSKFLPCSEPERLDPGINTNFFTMSDQFMAGSLFGAKGRRRLYTSQTEGYSNGAVLKDFGRVARGEKEVSGSTAQSFFKNLDDAAQNEIKKIVFPTLAKILGYWVQHLEALFLILWSLFLITNLFNCFGRIRIMVEEGEGCLKIMLATFSFAFKAFMPYTRLSQSDKDRLEKMETNIDQLSHSLSRMQVRLDTLILMPHRKQPNPVVEENETTGLLE